MYWLIENNSLFFSGLRVAWFHQHFIEQLDMNKCPLEEMRKRMKSGEREISLYIFYLLFYKISFFWVYFWRIFFFLLNFLTNILNFYFSSFFTGQLMGEIVTEEEMRRELGRFGITSGLVSCSFNLLFLLLSQPSKYIYIYMFKSYIYMKTCFMEYSFFFLFFLFFSFFPLFSLIFFFYKNTHRQQEEINYWVVDKKHVVHLLNYVLIDPMY